MDLMFERAFGDLKNTGNIKDAFTSSKDLNASSARAELIMTASLPQGKCVLSLPWGAYANAGLYGNSSTGFACTDARRARAARWPPLGPLRLFGSGDESPLHSGGRLCAGGCAEGAAGTAGPPSTVRLRCLVRRYWA